MIVKCVKCNKEGYIEKNNKYPKDWNRVINFATGKWEYYCEKCFKVKFNNNKRRRMV